MEYLFHRWQQKCSNICTHILSLFPHMKPAKLDLSTGFNNMSNKMGATCLSLLTTWNHTRFFVGGHVAHSFVLYFVIVCALFIGLFFYFAIWFHQFIFNLWILISLGIFCPSIFYLLISWTMKKIIILIVDQDSVLY